jgi:hypothetical protein
MYTIIGTVVYVQYAPIGTLGKVFLDFQRDARNESLINDLHPPPGSTPRVD